MNRSVLTKTLFAALVAAAPLAAQDDPIRFGAQLSFANPGGDLSSKDMASAGFGIGLFAEKPFTDNFALRGRFDYLIFGKKTYYEASGTNWHDKVDSDVSKYGISVDGVWSFMGHETGPFAFVTLGFESIKWELKATETWYGETDSASESENFSGLSYGVGFGYNFTRNFGAEVKYILGPEIKPKNWDEDSSGFSNNHIQVSVSYRF